MIEYSALINLRLISLLYLDIFKCLNIFLLHIYKLFLWYLSTLLYLRLCKIWVCRLILPCGNGAAWVANDEIATGYLMVHYCVLFNLFNQVILLYNSGTIGYCCGFCFIFDSWYAWTCNFLFSIDPELKTE